jgi:hypothetical protein
VDHFGLRNGRELFDRDKSSAAASLFDYIGNYMDALRAVGIAGLLNIGGRNYFKYKALLPTVYQTMDMKIHVNHKRSAYSEEEARFCLQHVTQFGLKVQQWIEAK